MCAGARAVQVGTAAFVDPAVLVGIVDELARLLKDAGTSIQNLCGTLQSPIAVPAQAQTSPGAGCCATTRAEAAEGGAR